MTKQKFPIILMYHGVVSQDVAVPPDRETGAELYDLDVQKFQEQMQFVKEHGYPVQTLEERESLEEREIILTFDDGELNNFQKAFPILRDFNFPAYFFVTVNRIGKKGYMGWEELMELRDSGMVIGSHGLNHQILTGLSNKKVDQELTESKAILENHLKINVDNFSVPRGFYNLKIIELAQGAGYKRVFVSQLQNSADTFCLERVAVKGDWSLKRFELALERKTPPEEVLVNSSKNIIKNIIGGSGYDRLRNFLLSKRK